MERWQYKIEFNYKTTSHANAKIIYTSEPRGRETRLPWEEVHVLVL